MQFHYYHDTTDRNDANDYTELTGDTVVEVWQVSKPANYPYELNSEGNNFLAVDLEMVDDDIESGQRIFVFAYNTQRVDQTYPPTTTLPSAEELEAMLTALING